MIASELFMTVFDEFDVEAVMINGENGGTQTKNKT